MRWEIIANVYRLIIMSFSVIGPSHGISSLIFTHSHEVDSFFQSCKAPPAFSPTDEENGASLMLSNLRKVIQLTFDGARI